MIHVDGRHVRFTPPDGAAYLIGDFTDWDERPIPLDGPVTLEFPCGAYVEYAFLDGGGAPLADPDTSVRPSHPWYDYHRSLTLSENRYSAPSQRWSLSGAVSELTLVSPVGGRPHRYQVYEPPTQPQATVSRHDPSASTWTRARSSGSSPATAGSPRCWPTGDTHIATGSTPAVTTGQPGSRGSSPGWSTCSARAESGGVADDDGDLCCAAALDGTMSRPANKGPGPGTSEARMVPVKLA